MELLNKQNYRRSAEFSEYLVTFEISLKADEDFEVEERLRHIFSEIEHFEPETITVTSQETHNEDGNLLTRSIETDKKMLRFSQTGTG